MPPKPPVIHTGALIFTGIFVIAWSITRACVQSITFDEAFTYLYFAKSLATVGEFSSNNHTLNTLLMWVSTQAFGPSNLTLRFPALLGAVLYVVVCYFLCRSIARRFILRLALFACLTCNPFILDFMVAARGYSLANAFFITALAVPLAWPEQKSLRTGCIVASTALGLSVTANLSFAFVDTMAFVALLVWALRRQMVSIPRILTYCTLPGLLVALAICGYPFAHWRAAQWKDDLWWGAHSLAEMRDSLIQPSLYQPDPNFLGRFYPRVMEIAPWLLPILATLCALQLAITRPRALTLAGVAVSTLGLSWLAFHFFNLPLPMGRTGIYFVPLCTLLAGTIAAAPTLGSAPATWLRRAITTMLLGLACYFLLCLRLSYFNEYKWNADVRETHAVLASLGVTDIQAAGIYQSALNYYREVYGPKTLPEFHIEIPEVTQGHAVYVLDGAYWRDFIVKEHLTILYKGKFSEVVVATR